MIVYIKSYDSENDCLYYVCIVYLKSDVSESGCLYLYAMSHMIQCMDVCNCILCHIIQCMVVCNCIINSYDSVHGCL